MHLVLAITFVTLVHSSDATLTAWVEDAHVKARVGDTTIDFGAGNDVRATTDGRDFQILWVDQNRVLGARWSQPSEITTFANGGRPGSIVWNGSAFQHFAGADAAAALKDVVLTTSGASTAAYTVCPFWPTFGGPKTCVTFPATYSLGWTVRPSDAPPRSASTSIDAGATPAVAAGNDEFLIVWRSSLAIEGVRVRRDGSIVGFINVPMAARTAQVAFDGTRYLIVFDANGDVWGAFVAPGVTYVAQPFAIASTAADETTPAVVAIAPDRFAVAYVVDRGQIATRVIPLSEKRRAAQ